MAYNSHWLRRKKVNANEMPLWQLDCMQSIYLHSLPSPAHPENIFWYFHFGKNRYVKNLSVILELVLTWKFQKIPGELSKLTSQKIESEMFTSFPIKFLQNECFKTNPLIPNPQSQSTCGCLPTRSPNPLTVCKVKAPGNPFSQVECLWRSEPNSSLLVRLPGQLVNLCGCGMWGGNPAPCVALEPT